MAEIEERKLPLIISSAYAKPESQYKTINDTVLGSSSKALQQQLAGVAGQLFAKNPKNTLLGLWSAGNWQRKDTASSDASRLQAQKDRLTAAENMSEADYQKNLSTVMSDFSSAIGDNANFANGRYINELGKFYSKKTLKPLGQAYRKEKNYETWQEYRRGQVMLAWNSFVNKLNTFIKGTKVKVEARILKSKENSESGLTAFRGIISAIRKKPELGKLDTIEAVQNLRIKSALEGMQGGLTSQQGRVQDAMTANKVQLTTLLRGEKPSVAISQASTAATKKKVKRKKEKLGEFIERVAGITSRQQWMTVNDELDKAFQERKISQNQYEFYSNEMQKIKMLGYKQPELEF